jgi:hypothetical protein
MDARTLRILIREKLADGRLPHGGMPRVRGGPTAGETCDACDEIVAKGPTPDVGHFSPDDGERGLQFHVPCFYIWDDERSAPGRDDKSPIARRARHEKNAGAMMESMRDPWPDIDGSVKHLLSQATQIDIEVSEIVWRSRHARAQPHGLGKT